MVLNRAAVLRGNSASNGAGSSQTGRGGYGVSAAVQIGGAPASVGASVEAQATGALLIVLVVGVVIAHQVLK